MTTHRSGPMVVLALSLAIWAPRWCRAETIYGAWNGNVSGFAEMTEGDQILSYESINSPGTLYMTFTTYDAAGDGTFVINLPYLYSPLGGGANLDAFGPQSVSLGAGSDSSSGYYDVNFFAAYTSITPAGALAGSWFAAADATFFYGGPQPDGTAFTEFVAFSIPEPPSITLAASAALLCGFYASRHRLRSLNNLVTRGRAR